MPANPWNKTYYLTTIIFLVIFGYAIVRYNIYKGVPASNIPLYISNKAFALSSVVLLGISFVLGPFTRRHRFFSRWRELRGPCGTMGFLLAGLHAILSTLLVSPQYYPAIFADDGTMATWGELAMLSGAVALVLFVVVAVAFVPGVNTTLARQQRCRIRKLVSIGLLIVLIHTFAFSSSWMVPGKWPGKLVPISLWGFIVVLLALAYRTIMHFLTVFKGEEGDNED